MHHVVREDRLWFQRHPTAIVRFRKSASGEFAPLQKQGDEPPAFRPSFSKASAPLSWVAVVDLMQLLGSSAGQAESAPCARLRLRTPALRSKDHRQAAKQELMEAVAAELLGQSEPNQSDSPGDETNKDVNTPSESEDEIAA
ncbi:hypothetical protein [Synechococcus sp. UW140]|uniref:hypothetical protein n=1 Tax=Synechococcus sp. UW140 TaxID=368503 RepID=UPI000E0F2A6E|nr:hypothetical protein [Synechococcus sp. UW140]